MLQLHAWQAASLPVKASKLGDGHAQVRPVILDKAWEVCAKEPVQEAVPGHWVEEEQDIGRRSPPKRLCHTAQ